MNAKAVRAYIDGFNLYHAIEKLADHRAKWINLRKVCETLLRSNEYLDEVHFFTAVWTFEGKKQLRHKNFLKAQKAVGVTVHEGRFSKPTRWCEREEQYCPFREEKQTDVGLALKVARDALERSASRLILITADSDQIPTARLVNSIDGVRLSLAFPPGRAQEARDLGNLIPDKRELKAGRLMSCKLPRTVEFEGKPVAQMPALYLETR